MPVPEEVGRYRLTAELRMVDGQVVRSVRDVAVGQ